MQTAAITVLGASPALLLKLPVTRRELEGLLGVLLEQAERQADRSGGVPREVELAIVGDGDIARLNRQAMGVLGPTNILSFPGDPLDTQASLALSADTFARESFLYGQDRMAYLVRLLAHGLAHVCGFDHSEAMDDFAQGLEAAAEKKGYCS